LCLTFYAVTAYSQKSSVQSLGLTDMSSFKSQAGNWQVVGDVIIDPAIDVHHEQVKQVVPETPNKKKKKSSEPVATAMKAPKAVTFQPGNGILLNINDAAKKDNLITAFEHGDIELELEVMLPKGSYIFRVATKFSFSTAGV
jgi:hypothetical protein